MTMPVAIAAGWGAVEVVPAPVVVTPSFTG